MNQYERQNRTAIRRTLRKGKPHQIWQRARETYKTHHDHYGELDTVEQADIGEVSLLEMAAGDIDTSVSGVLNKLFGGRTVWGQLNVSSFAYGSLPKVDPTTVRPPGWRAKTAFADTGKGGNAEGTIPSRVRASYFEVEPTIKEHATHMGVSGLQQDLVEIEDAYGALADIQQELGEEHLKQHERAITEDIDTTSGNNIESLDRVTGAESLVASHGLTAGDADIHNIDRSAESWADAHVDDNGNTNRNLSLSLIDDAIQNVRQNGGNTTFYVTGWDTWKELSSLVGDQGRFDMQVADLVTSSVNDADVPEGLSISTFINHYQGRPVVPSDQVQTDGIGRIYGLDISNPEGKPSPRLGVEVLRPTTTFTAGERTGGSPQALDFLGDTALAVTRHEVVCRFFAAQFQIRDLKAQ